MSLVALPDLKEAKAIEVLAQFLIASGSNAKEQLETIQELRKYEYITEEGYERMIRNEFLGIIKDLQRYIDIYMPFQ